MNSGTRGFIVWDRDGGEHDVLYSPEDAEAVEGYSWYLVNGYVGRYDRSRCKTVYLHREALGIVDGPSRVQGDHINGDRLDNRQENLRAVTASGNALNRRTVNGRGSSRYSNVHWAEGQRRWRASVTVEGKRTWLGSYQTEEEARLAVISYRERSGLPSGY